MRVWNQCNTLIIAILYDKKNASNFKIKHGKRLEYLLVSCFDKRKSSDMTTTSAILLHILSIIYHIFSIDTLILHNMESHNMIWYMIDRIWSNMALHVVISFDFRLLKQLTRRYSNLLPCFILKFDAFFLLHKFAIIYVLHWFYTLRPISYPSLFSHLFIDSPFLFFIFILKKASTYCSRRWSRNLDPQIP